MTNFFVFRSIDIYCSSQNETDESTAASNRFEIVLKRVDLEEAIREMQPSVSQVDRKKFNEMYATNLFPFLSSLGCLKFG